MQRYLDLLKYRNNKFYAAYVDYIRRPVKRFYRKHIQRYHLLDYRDLPHGYDGGYTDPCEQVLLANFAILKNFVEKEKPFEIYDLSMHKDGKFYINNSGEEAEPYYNEIWEIYQWWIRGRFEEQAAINILSSQVSYTTEPTDESDPKYGRYYTLIHHGPHEELRALQDEYEKKQDTMLARLIAIRRHLWT